MKPEDRAQELELEEWEARQRNAILPHATRPSAMQCVDCDIPIPEERRKHVPGVERCVECQKFNERKGRRGK